MILYFTFSAIVLASQYSRFWRRVTSWWNNGCTHTHLGRNGFGGVSWLQQPTRGEALGLLLFGPFVALLVAVNGAFNLLGNLLSGETLQLPDLS